MVFPSLPEGEGMPGVLIEAGLSGLCVLATAVPGVSDVVLNGVTGAVVEVSDFSGLCQRGAATHVGSGPPRRDGEGQHVTTASHGSAWRRVPLSGASC